ncbi:MAG: NADH-quinone oxidoreductase subunit NuoF [Legionellales bacterium]|nr:NADH-quinone oxidoreductase subunit NuoF [Legionellales bacterium]
MANEVCFRTIHLERPWDIATYESAGGYKMIRKILSEQTSRDDIIQELKTANLRGRGGAGFPTGLKWSFMSPKTPGQKYLVVNSDEGEPGTCKDRDILRYNPHQLLEGIMIACYCIGADVCFNYIRGEYWEPFTRVEQALQQARDAGLIGKNILNSGFNLEIHNLLGAGAYICGEETSLMNSIEGRKGYPRFKPPFPANYGVYGKPTTINNTESIASVPVILEKGAKWFLELGRPDGGGSRLFSVTGHVNRPGNYEVPLGTPFRELLEMAGGVRNGNQLKAVIPGGTSMPVLPGNVMLNLNMDYDSVSKAGSNLGSGAVIIMDETTCMVKALCSISEFYSNESCGQCTPCREGTGWIERMVHRIEHGLGQPDDLERLRTVAKNIEGRTICALGEAAAWPVGGMLKHFYDEFEYHITHKKCMVGNHAH